MERNLTEGKPLGILCRFALPLMIGNAFQLGYTIADGAVVGRLLGVEAFAAVGASALIYWLVFDIILGLTQGFGLVLSQRYGAGDQEGLKKTYAAALLLTLGIGLVLSAGMVLLTGAVLRLLNTPAALVPDAQGYLSILFGGIVITFLYNTYASTFRALGDSKTPLYALIIASIANIAMDILLVRFTPLGVRGIALATVAAQTFSCVYCQLRLKGMPSLRLTRLSFTGLKPHLQELMRIGGPMGLRNGASSIGGVILQCFINGYGATFIAGIAAAGKLSGLLGIVGSAFDGSVAIFTAQNYGAQKLDRVRASVSITRRIMLLSAAAMIALLFPLGRTVLGWFLSGDAAVVGAALDVATRQLRIALLSLPMLFMLYLYRSVLQSIGRPLMPMISGFIELAVRVLMPLLLTGLIGEWSIYLTDATGWTACAVCLYLAYRRAAKQIYPPDPVKNRPIRP